MTKLELIKALEALDCDDNMEVRAADSYYETADINNVSVSSEGYVYLSE
jgi:hypothetical protein